jgi:tol-pal system protein YbgF
VTAALVAVVTAGCATRGSVQEIQTDVGKVRAEVTEVRLAQDLVSAELARVLAELRSVDVRSAETQQTLRDAASEIVKLRARLQTTEDELRQSRLAQGTRPATPPAPPTPPPPAPVVRAPVATKPPAALPAPADADAAREPRDEPAEHAYAAALNTFRAREHGQAVLDLMDFIVKYPKHSLAPRAQYWIGEAYYIQRDYPQALIEFNRVLQMAPTAASAADALLRIGMCHANLREPAPAAAAWQRVMREHPRSEAAGKARSFLRAGAAPR